MKKLGFILVLFLISFATSSQKNNSKNRPPWVNESLPLNSATYNYKVVQGDGTNLPDAKNNAFEALIVDLGSEQGVTESYTNSLIEDIPSFAPETLSLIKNDLKPVVVF